jgi:serine/threonine protein kinase
MSKVFTITEGLENMGALRTGGQGSVYKGRKMGPIITAVKILPTPIHTANIEDKNYRKFVNEVEKLKKVNEVPNPNVVKIINSGLTESGSFPFIEMEYIEGPDLEELLKAPHDPIFTIRETIKLAEQLANALCHCHRVGVKHGDIKSNNVKFNTDTGNYILLDFGLAIMSDEQRRSSVQHAGAVEFMAPEQHDGEMFFQTDIYSYGVILYELLAGTVPFPLINKGENSRNTVMLAHLEKQVPDLLMLRRTNMPVSWTEEVKAREMNVPSWLISVIHKCLEKQPEKRFANGAALYDALLHHSTPQLVPEPVLTSKQEAVITEPDDSVKVSKPIFYVMILLLVALSAFAVYSILLIDTDKNLKPTQDSLTNTMPVDTTTPEVQDTVPDTASQIKPVMIDSALAQSATEVDSLKKEFERQTAANAVKPPVAPKSDLPVISSGGVSYQIPKATISFYDAPTLDAPKNSVFNLWTSSTKFTVVDEQNGFIYVTHTSASGEVTKGWLNKSDLKELP